MVLPDGGRWTTPIAQRQGSLHWSGGYEVYPDRDGNGLMVTPSLGLMQTLIPWLEETDAAADLPDRERYPDLIAAREGDAARDGDAARLDGGERGG